MNELLVVSVALEKGIYVKEENGDIRFIEPNFLMFYGTSLHLVREVYINHYELLRDFDIGNYKQTWSLQKEDLL